MNIHLHTFICMLFSLKTVAGDCYVKHKSMQAAKHTCLQWLSCCSIRKKWTWQEAGERKQQPKGRLQVPQFTFVWSDFSRASKAPSVPSLPNAVRVSWHTKAEIRCISGLFYALVPIYSDNTEEIPLQTPCFWSDSWSFRSWLYQSSPPLIWMVGQLSCAHMAWHDSRYCTNWGACRLWKSLGFIFHSTQ